MIKNRKAFSLITAILTIFFISSLAGFILNLSSKLVSETVSEYKKEQSILYSKSYTGMAILAASANNCIKTIKSTEGDYSINVLIKYIGNEVSSTIGCTDVNSIGDEIKHIPSKGNTIMIDTFVRYKDKLNQNNPDVTYYRRTIQKL